MARSIFTNSESLLQARTNRLTKLFNSHKLEQMRKESLRYIKSCLVTLKGIGAGIGTLWVFAEFAGLFNILLALCTIAVSTATNYYLVSSWLGSRQIITTTNRF